MCIRDRGGVRQWCLMFKNASTNVHDDERSGWPSVLTDKLVEKNNKKIRENRRFTITELSHEFPQISCSLLHEAVTIKLGYHKFCAQWVPKVLRGMHRNQRMASALSFLETYNKVGDSLPVSYTHLN